MAVTPKSLIARLGSLPKQALEAAAARSISRTHYAVEPEHWLLALLDQPAGDLPLLLKQFNLDANRVKAELDRSLATLRTGNTRGPGFSPEVLDLTREAWVIGSVECGAGEVRSGHILAAFVSDRTLSQRLAQSSAELAKLRPDALLDAVQNLLPQSDSPENRASATTPAGLAPLPQSGGALDLYTENLTERAKAGKIDPVVGREAEIRQVIDVLMRRRQNNPILTGEAGVGKTAVVEGLAVRVAEGDVPEPLKNIVLRTLDLGLLQAGAGVKGEFEARLTAVIKEVKASPAPVILFIDEAHTLIGAGGQAGQNDAANLLKPALARGELRTIAATTFAEYKKYFATDAALKRRFQPVRVDEPAEPVAVRMVRSLVAMLEKHHAVTILDEAVADAVRLSARYMPDRQLPDKAVSLLDTACARVRLSQSATPAELDDTLRELAALAVETQALERETGHPDRLTELTARRQAAEATRDRLTARLEQERRLVRELKAARAQGPDGTDDAARLSAELSQLQGETPLVEPVVHGGAVARTVAALTGIPVGRMVRDEVQMILSLADRLNERVVGQRHALDAIAQRIRTARADLADPRRPQGVFLLVGPSGVGKTETALALADALYGGDRNVVVVNMSEYKEPHKVSRLVGSAKGYVGYGEGGVLTNAVKAKPHAVVLLDEVEKAHESVQEIFYQVFDKGVLQNDDGEDVNFKNTIILLTSNAGTDLLMKLCADPETMPSPAALEEALRPELLKVFKPALLGRMTVVPYFPLGDEVIRRVIGLKLGQVAARLKANHKAELTFSPAVTDAVADRCRDVDSGARTVDHILTGSILPSLSELVLGRLAAGDPVKAVGVDVAADGQFVVSAG